jgi:hypothetical protein
MIIGKLNILINIINKNIPHPSRNTQPDGNPKCRSNFLLNDNSANVLNIIREMY